LSATIVGSIVAKLSNQNGLGLLNRIFGFVTASAKYFLIFALIITALANVTLVKDNIGKYVKDSKLYPYLQQTGAYLINLDINALVSQVNKKTKEITTSKDDTFDDTLSKF
jgi:membrane protein required for colicin V production